MISVKKLLLEIFSKNETEKLTCLSSTEWIRDVCTKFWVIKIIKPQ